MYSVASRGSNLKDLLWVIIGISTWGLVQSQVELMYWAITSEREWLRNIKNIILSPTPFFIYLSARASLVSRLLYLVSLQLRSFQIFF